MRTLSRRDVWSGFDVCFTLTAVQALFSEKPYQEQQMIEENSYCTISGTLIGLAYVPMVFKCLFSKVLNLASYAEIDVKFGRWFANVSIFHKYRS